MEREGTYPNATEAGAPRMGRLAKDRSVSCESWDGSGRRGSGAYSGRKWCSGRELWSVSLASLCGVLWLAAVASKHTDGQQHEADGEVGAFANGGAEGRGRSSLPDV